MSEIKIYQKRKTFYFTIIFSVLLFIGFGYFVFFSGSSQVTSSIKYTFFAFTIFLSYTNYVSFTRNRKQIPTLVISEFAIEFCEYLKSTTYLWKDILEWKIEKDEGTNYLTLTTIEKIKRKVNISFLEKSPAEIEELIKEIKKH